MDSWLVKEGITYENDADMKANNAYACETFKPVDPILQEVLDRSDKLQIPNIHVGAMPGQHLQVMIKMAGYKKAVEIGTLVGFSGICIARAIGPDGVLHTIDADAKFAEIAKESFEKAGVVNNVRVHVGNAVDVLETLNSEGPFDIVFIDADKINYPNYLKWAERNLRVGGAVIGDNTFGFGRMRDKTFPNQVMEESIYGLRQFNETVANSPNWHATILPTTHGMTVAVKVA